jgi:hypothetical protein
MTISASISTLNSAPAPPILCSTLNSKPPIQAIYMMKCTRQLAKWSWQAVDVDLATWSWQSSNVNFAIQQSKTDKVILE